MAMACPLKKELIKKKKEDGVKMSAAAHLQRTYAGALSGPSPSQPGSLDLNDIMGRTAVACVHSMLHAVGNPGEYGKELHRILTFNKLPVINIPFPYDSSNIYRQIWGSTNMDMETMASGDASTKRSTKRTRTRSRTQSSNASRMSRPRYEPPVVLDMGDERLEDLSLHEQEEFSEEMSEEINREVEQKLKTGRNWETDMGEETDEYSQLESERENETDTQTDTQLETIKIIVSPEGKPMAYMQKPQGEKRSSSMKEYKKEAVKKKSSAGEEGQVKEKVKKLEGKTHGQVKVKGSSLKLKLFASSHDPIMKEEEFTPPQLTRNIGDGRLKYTFLNQAYTDKQVENLFMKDGVEIDTPNFMLLPREDFKKVRNGSRPSDPRRYK